MLSSLATIAPRRLWITRKKRGFSRKQLAAYLGHATPSQICRWEQGSHIPSLPNALLLGHLLQMPVECLFEELRNEVVRHAQAHRRRTQGDDTLPPRVGAESCST